MPQNNSRTQGGTIYDQSLEQFEESLNRFGDELRTFSSETTRLNLGQIDHKIDIAKFFVSLFSTVLIAAIGLNEEVESLEKLIYPSLVFLTIIVILLVYFMHKRSEEVAKESSRYEKLFEYKYKLEKLKKNK